MSVHIGTDYPALEWCKLGQALTWCKLGQEPHYIDADIVLDREFKWWKHEWSDTEILHFVLSYSCFVRFRGRKPVKLTQISYGAIEPVLDFSEWSDYEEIQKEDLLSPRVNWLRSNFLAADSDAFRLQLKGLMLVDEQSPFTIFWDIEVNFSDLVASCPPPAGASPPRIGGQPLPVGRLSATPPEKLTAPESRRPGRPGVEKTSCAIFEKRRDRGEPLGATKIDEARAIREEWRDEKPHDDPPQAETIAAHISAAFKAARPDKLPDKL